MSGPSDNIDSVDQAAMDLESMGMEEQPGAEERRQQATQIAVMFVTRFNLDIMNHPKLKGHIQGYVKYNQGFDLSIPSPKDPTKTLKVALGSMPHQDNTYKGGICTIGPSCVIDPLRFQHHTVPPALPASRPRKGSSEQKNIVIHNPLYHCFFLTLQHRHRHHHHHHKGVCPNCTQFTPPIPSLL